MKPDLDRLAPRMHGLALVAAAVVIGTFAVLAGPARAQAAELLVGAGDRLRVSVMGLPSAQVDAVVAPDGGVNLGWLGRVPAAGKTVADLTEELRRAATGKVIKSYSSEGEVTLVRVDRNDLFLAVAEYRPVVVSGEVVAPGEMAFRPGLTARQAIARAGGAQSAILSRILDTAPVQIVRWQNDQAQAALEHAVATVRLWRLATEIDNDPDAPPPGPDQVAVETVVLRDLIAEQARIADTNRRNEAAERAFLQDALEKTRDRIAIMEQQRQKTGELLAADEEEEARIAELLERGLTPATRMADIRRTTLLSATRLLDLEESLASARLELVRLQRALDEYDEKRLSGLLAEREATYAQELDARLRMGLMAQNLSGATGGAAEPDLRLAVIRDLGGTREPVEIGLDDALLPGDTLVVTVPDAGQFLPAGQ